MRQSNVKNTREVTAFLYVRLSRDDGLEGDSYSISNQKTLLTKIAKEKGYSNIVIFCDDGISGVTMNRPDFNRMIEQIKLGKAAAVFVKDLSRLGRNYIEVGRLTEEFFPEHDIRLVAVSDNYDSFEGENELAPIKNLFNEWYARDISKKRRISNKIKGSSGIPLGPPPYGYMKSPENPNFWIVDLEAAVVVRRIFSMAYEGTGVEVIAARLTEEKVLTPTEYAKAKGVRKASAKKNNNPYAWSKSTVRYILSLQEYCGDVINFKTYSVSYKNKKRHENSPENMMVFKNVHEAIIDREVFERVRSLMERARNRPMRDGEHSMFSGILRCAECGRNLHYHFNQANHDIKYFNCSGYNSVRKECSATHYIRVDFLEQVVLSEIRRLTQFAVHHEEQFSKVVSDYSRKHLAERQLVLSKELKTLLDRDKEIDRLFERIYEDNVCGKISDERFNKMSKNYEAEQQGLKEKIEEIDLKIEELSAKSEMVDSFVASVRKYTRIRKLTPLVLNELIEYIEVYHAEKINGTKSQRLIIHYNCIGSVDIPSEVPIRLSEVELQTRKGVTVNYCSAPVSVAI